MVPTAQMLGLLCAVIARILEQNQKTRVTRPRYYLQNFHFQSGGWMTDDSAERYDTQVEVLLNGTANAM
jgi:hypothetical protein